MHRRLLIVLGLGVFFSAAPALSGLAPGAKARSPETQELSRPPAVPLVVHDPYFSIWSRADRLTDVDTTHWTGKPHPLTGMVWVDDQAYRVMGAEPAGVPALPQTSVEVFPTRTVCTFENEIIRVTLTFLTPMLPDDLELLSRPLTYIVWDAKLLDGAPRRVRLHLEVSPLLVVNTPDQAVTLEDINIPGFRTFRMGTREQAILERQGDDVRIDWGHCWLAARLGQASGRALVSTALTRPSSGVTHLKTVQPDRKGVFSMGSGRVALGKDRPLRMVVMLAYDDLYSIRYFFEDLRPYWRRDKKWAAEQMLMDAADRFEEIEKRCKAFDEELMADLERLGGPGYAKLCALAYRQAFGGAKLVADAAGKPLFFTKECHSNGCIGTVDVFYPQSPQCLFFSPALMKATVVPILDYASSPRWKFPFAPHDLGRYPYATGQVYGGGEKSDERQMMVEESANMVLLVAAIAEAEGKTAFAERYWPLLEKWAAYLEAKGFDPENQLCTDDFAGHLAHNVNLSVKAIVALGAFGKLCEKRGLKEDAKRYGGLARGFARRWLEEADDGDHFRLAFDKPGTWSQKYNLVWDRVLDLGLFPEEAIQKEVEYYKKVQRPFGLPLDSRQTYTKLDWILWSAAITGDRDDFEALLNPVLQFLNKTPDRFPMTDWYFTDTAKRRGFTARPVVGGVFMHALGDRDLWRKWARRGANVEGPWAPLPLRETKAVLATGEDRPAPWRVCFEAPPEDWTEPEFDDSKWNEAPAPFGRGPTSSGNIIRTEWKGREIWARRSFDLEDAKPGAWRLRLSHSGDAEVYLNGVPAARRPGGTRAYDYFKILPDALKTLQAGRNVLAVHARAGGRRAHLDCGIVALGQTVPSGIKTLSSTKSVDTGKPKKGKHTAYLFAHMTKSDYGHLYYSVSTDGLNWKRLNDGKRVLGEEYRGHPDICRGHDGRYYMLGNHSRRPEINIWVSDDLVNWSKFGELRPDVTKTPNLPHPVRYMGAPKIFYDEPSRRYLITWHTPTEKGDPKDPEKFWRSMKTLYVTSKDLRTFSDPKRLFSFDMATIDVVVRRVGDRFYAIVKDEKYPSFDWPTGKTIRISSAPDMLGPYSDPSPPISPNFREAPALIPTPDGRAWYMYYEQYPGVSYGLSTAPELEGPWYDVYCMKYQVPEGARHGCMIPISRKQYDDIVAAYGSKGESQ